MSSEIETGKAYLQLQMPEEARRAFEAIPRGHPDYFEARRELTWLSDRMDRGEQRCLALEGDEMIRAGCRDSNVISDTALCHFFAGNARAAYGLLARYLLMIKWTASDRYAFATYAAAVGRWAEAAWLLWLCQKNGGDPHMFFDLDLLPLWDFAAGEELDALTALALAHPMFESALNEASGRSREIDPTMQKALPSKFHAHLAYLNEGGLAQLSPSAPADIQSEFEAWRSQMAFLIEFSAGAAFANARRVVLNHQLPWAVAAARRGDFFAARWHTQFALAARPDWLEEFASKLSPHGMQAVMNDLRTGLSRDEQFCQLLLNAKPPGAPEHESLLIRITDLGRGTGYELLARAHDAAKDNDDRTRVEACLALMRRWGNDPAASGHLIGFFCSKLNWAAANWIVRRAPRSLTCITHAKKLFQQVAEHRLISGASPSMSEPFYGQPDIGGLVRYGDFRWMALGRMRRKAEPPPPQRVIPSLPANVCR